MLDSIKKKLKKKILKFAILVGTVIIGVVIVSTGVGSVASFFSNMFTKERATEADIDSMSLDDLIAAVKDHKVITDEMIYELMIDRNTLIDLLEAVRNYNTNWLSKKKKIQYRHDFSIEEEYLVEVWDDVPYSGGVQSFKEYETRTRKVSKTEYGWKDYPVSVAEVESSYLIDWQVLYVVLIMQALENYQIENEFGEDLEVDKIEDEQSVSTKIANKKVPDAGDEENDTVGTQEFISTPYDKEFREAASKTGVPVNLLKSLSFAESSWKSDTVSSAGAVGLMQLMEPTALTYGCTDRYDPASNIMAGAKYFKSCLVAFDGDISWAVCAYNSGIQGAKNKNGVLPTNSDFKTYLSNVLSMYSGDKIILESINVANLNLIGTFEDGILSLTKAEIDELINDFKPKFLYQFDVVRDSRKKYDFNECQALPNDGKKTNGGDPNTEEGLITWYEPKSLLNSIELPYADIIFAHDGNKIACKSESLNMYRLELKITKYWPYYDFNFFLDLLRELPSGDAVVDAFLFKYGAEVDEYEGGNYNGTFFEASGIYQPLDEVNPSINIPTNAGGMSIPLYTQYDSRWGRVAPVGDGTMSSSGCGLTSLAMVLSYLENKTIYPTDIYAWCGNRYSISGVGQSWNLISDGAAHWGYMSVSQVPSANAIISELSKGRPVIVSTGNGGSKYFTSGGHFIVLRGLTADGKVLVNDPNDSVGRKDYYKKAYDVSFIVNECRKGDGSLKMMWSFYK